MADCGAGKKRCSRGTRCNKKTRKCAPYAKKSAAPAPAAKCSVKNRNALKENSPVIIPAGKMPLKYRSCFSSVCASGYGISAVKSGLQKYLRRRERLKMKWCATEIYKFKFGWTTPTEKKVAKGIITNLANRFIVMLDEELIFDEAARYLYIREELLPKIVAEETTESEGVHLLGIVCDLLCDGRLLRLNSDINAYFGVRVVRGEDTIEAHRCPDAAAVRYIGREGDSPAFIENMRNFIGWFRQKDARCYYWMFHIYNMGEGHTARRYNRREAIYGLWEFLEPVAAVQPRAARLFQYRLRSFFEKEKKERRMFMISTVNMCLYMDEIDWTEEIIPPPQPAATAPRPDRLELDEYCIDMHCAEGRKCGKDKSTFATEGSFVVDEYNKYKVAEWRDYYVREKMDAQPPPHKKHAKK